MICSKALYFCYGSETFFCECFVQGYIVCKLDDVLGLLFSTMFGGLALFEYRDFSKKK